MDWKIGILCAADSEREPFLAVRTATDTASHSVAADFEENSEKASALSADFVVGLLKVLRNAY